MHLIFVLLFVLFPPADSQDMASVVSRAYATQAQCEAAGEKIAELAHKAVQANDLKDFFGACTPVDLDEVAKDKTGSI